jgi:hypothetical protein
MARCIGDRQTGILSTVSSQLLHSCGRAQKHGHKQKQFSTSMTSLLTKRLPLAPLKNKINQTYMQSSSPYRADVSLMKAIRLMLYREIIAVFFKDPYGIREHTVMTRLTSDPANEFFG